MRINSLRPRPLSLAALFLAGVASIATSPPRGWSLTSEWTGVPFSLSEGQPNVSQRVAVNANRAALSQGKLHFTAHVEASLCPSPRPGTVDLDCPWNGSTPLRVRVKDARGGSAEVVGVPTQMNGVRVSYSFDCDAPGPCSIPLDIGFERTQGGAVDVTGWRVRAEALGNEGNRPADAEISVGPP